MAPDALRQAGGIVVRNGDGGPRVLLVTARRNRKRWVFPKGTVKRREEPEDAAVREVWEEAGVKAKMVGPAGVARHSTRGGRVTVEYFLLSHVRQDDDGGEKEREVRWCAIEDAMAMLSYASARRILLEAYPEILRRQAKKRAQGGR